MKSRLWMASTARNCEFVRMILLLEVLLFTAAIGPLGASSLVSGMRIGTQQQTSRSPRGIRGALIHRDRFSSLADNFRTPTEKLDEDAQRSVGRARILSHKGRILLDTLSTSPSGQPGVSWETNVSDASDAEYLMQISLGTPPQTFVAVADTGSDLTWLQCLPCKNCFQQSDPVFNPSLSSTYAPLSCSSPLCEFLNSTAACPYVPTAPAEGCGYTYKYNDGSLTTGTLAADTISIMDTLGGTQTVSGYWFGCSNIATTSSGLYDNADGLVGLGRGLASFPSQLGAYFGNKFSYCLVNRSSSAVEDSPLIFGDAAVPTDGLNLQYIQMITNPVSGFQDSFYYVNLEGITVNGVAVPNIPADAFAIDPVTGSGGTIFDSGTTFTSVVDDIYNPLVAAISDVIVDFDRYNTSNKNFEFCYAASWDTWVNEYGNQVPALSFVFDSAETFDLLVDGSWVHYSDGVVCLAILRSSGFNIFGNVQQAGYLILYDLESSQIGFGKRDCY